MLGRSCPSLRLSVYPHTLTRQIDVTARIKIPRQYLILVLTGQLCPPLDIKLKVPQKWSILRNTDKYKKRRGLGSEFRRNLSSFFARQWFVFMVHFL
jgi:hypothetical protein